MYNEACLLWLPYKQATYNTAMQVNGPQNIHSFSTVKEHHYMYMYKQVSCPLSPARLRSLAQWYASTSWDQATLDPSKPQ